MRTKKRSNQPLKIALAEVDKSGIKCYPAERSSFVNRPYVKAVFCSPTTETSMKTIKLGALLMACALTIGAGIGLYLTRVPATEPVAEKTLGEPIQVTLQFPLGIK